MKLLSASIRNFRSYKEAVTIEFGNFTAVVGRNDVGKSTLLEALEIFFNHQLIKLDQDDPCVHGADKVIEIGCVFDSHPRELTIDAVSPTSLEAEFLLNRNGRLEIVKQFDCSGRTVKEFVFARARHPIHDKLRDLLKLKNTDLKARATELGVQKGGGVDFRSNAALREAIRVAVGDRACEETLIPLATEDGKKVWEQLEKHLPAFALFQADRASRDDDREVSDPMKIAMALAVKEVEAELSAIKDRVQASVMEVAERTLAKLREMDPALAGQLTPTFKAEPKWDAFKLSLTGDDQIPINKRGSGVRRLILLNFFRAEAERRRGADGTGNVIYAVEEPESSQHPDNQVMLIKALLDLGNDPGSQVLITTHVPAVAAMVPVAAIRLVKRDGDGHPRLRVGGDDVYRETSEALGVLPDRRARVAVYVEGPHDVTFLTFVGRLYRAEDASLIDLENDHRVAFVPTGGGNLKHWVNKQYLRNAALTEVHIYDRDDQQNPKYGAQVIAVNARQGRDIAFLTDRREMENYIHPDCIAAVFGGCPAFTDWCDVPSLVAEHVHAASASPNLWGSLDPEKQSKKASRAKSRLNQEAVVAMTLVQLKAIDTNGEILGWLVAIRERAEI
ncbi:ATP-binding protein [Methylobacterium sp. J-092]|uniref:ATP-binding protein n=1 Tax=Methylobacterium sp. J-092 TaxID=2836667 RepID=UPI001FB91565|nr:ATP-binding protein [Methylobacterium sp. J-092]MCJ2008397.1 ATP-binding protein [Methylobacterium sp. J-092]